jgi:hypothetical protein
MLVALVGCGDNRTCEPVPPALPDGPVVDPYALLPDGCIPNGLVEAPGRWFVADHEQSFLFEYPMLAGDCGTGFRRAFAPAEDHDLRDGSTFYTWSDGTIYFERTEYATLPKSTVIARAYCSTGLQTLAGAYALYSRDTLAVTPMTGMRFGRKDVLAQGLTLLGEVSPDVTGKPMIPLDLAIDGGYAYVVGERGLDIIDVTDPTSPRPVSHLDGSFNDVAIIHGDGRTAAYLAPFSGDHTLIIDVTDATTPAFSSQLPDYSHTLFHTTRDGGSQLYLATYTNDIPILDVSHPFVPARLGSTHVPGVEGGVHDMFVDGDVIYANNTTAGFVAFDVSAGLDHPALLGQVGTSYSHSSIAGVAGGRPIVLHGDEGMTGTSDGAAFLRILDGDRTSPTYLTELARYRTRPEVGIHNFQLVGERLYISYYQDGIRVVDLRDPVHPREIAHYNTWDPTTAPGDAFEGAVGIEVVDNLIYVADLERGLMILRIDG